MDDYGVMCTTHNEVTRQLCLQCVKFLCFKCLKNHRCHYIMYDDELFMFNSSEEIATLLTTHLQNIDKLESDLKEILQHERERATTKIAALQSQKATFLNDAKQCTSDALIQIIHKIKENPNYNVVLKDAKEIEYKKFEEMSNSLYKATINSKKIHTFPNPKVYILNQQTNTATGYELVKTSMKEVTPIKFNVTIPECAESIYANFSLYITGGIVNQLPIKDSYSYNCDKHTTTKASSMIIGKFVHSLVQIKGVAIYTIGGYDNHEDLGTCEEYNIIKDEWRQIPSLKTPRRACAACSFNNKYIYAIAGYCKQNISSIERICIQEGTNTPWESISLTTKGEWSERHAVHAIQCSDNAIIIAGGYFGSHQSFLFKIHNDEHNISEATALPNNDSFYSTMAPINDGDYSYFVSYKKTVYCYSCFNNKWIEIPLS